MPLSTGSRLGPYEILSQIGAGGMGEVYRARDSKLGRDVAIKVLPSSYSSDPDRLRRFEQEARAAAALNHPNILSVFQMGTYEGAPYLVSELLEGSTLREQLKRGPMPLRKAIDSGILVARGLAAAHEKGIVHRDLKPENLFVAKGGRVKILDFGLAKLTQREWAPESNAPTVSIVTEPGAVMGTVGYMSPEQVRGGTADPRADIFAFGAILYEMLTGKRAFQKPTSAETMTAILNEDPPSISQLAPGLPSALQRVVHRCLEKDPEQRFHSASDLAFALEALSDSCGTEATAVARPATRRIWLSAAALILVLLGGAIGGYFYFHHAPVLTERDSIVVADFTNTTGDSVFDGALRQGLSVQLEQTPFLSLVSGDRINQTLALMEKPPGTRLTPDVAREVCQRLNATAVIQGSIAALGSQYVIGLNAQDCHTGDSLAEEQVTADSKERVLAALGAAGSELRSKLGESAASLKTFGAPFDQAITTSSLDALQAYTRGTDALLNGNFPSAISFLQRAVTLDPNFATAFSLQGTTYSMAGEDDLGAERIAKAYSLRGRVSEREQFSITANYAVLVTRDADEAVRIGEQWAKVFPRDTPAYISLYSAYYFAGQLDQVLQTAQKVVRLDPTPFAYYQLPRTYVMLGRPDDADAAIGQAEANHVDPVLFRDLSYFVAFLRNDSATMDRLAASPWVTGLPGEAAAVQANTAAYHGQLARSRDFMKRAIASAKQQEGGPTATYKLCGALTEALLGNLPEARRAAEDAGKSHPGGADEGNIALILALAGDIEQSRRFADDLKKRSPAVTYLRFGMFPTIQAVVALQRNRPDEALEALRPISSRELVPAGVTPQALPFMVPVYIRGQAYLMAHQGANASADFQLILDHPGFVLNSITGALAHLGLGRAYALQGDTAKAKAAYQGFFTLWKDADPDIPIFKQAKAEYAKLQ